MATSVIAFVQARMGSSRFPGKVLELIGGRPMLECVVERASRANTVDEVVVLTSNGAQDDRIFQWCSESGTPCVRGEELDVLARFCQGVDVFESEVVVRLTADCPLLDPAVVDECVQAFLGIDELAYVANRMPDHRTYPIGLDVEVFSRSSLLRANRESTEPYRREHVTPWFYDGGFDGRIVEVRAPQDYGEERWTVDTRDDLAFVREVMKRVSTESWLEVLEVLSEEPDLRCLNAHIEQKTFLEVEADG